jgi:REase_DpnII-MboI
MLRGSHQALTSLFVSSGAQEPPSDIATLSHATKWKEWLFRIGQDPNIDSLSFLGNVIEESMDSAPEEWTPEYDEWKTDRERVLKALEESGLRYYRGGRVLPVGQPVPDLAPYIQRGLTKPSDVDELLLVLVKGLRRAMYPLTNRRRGATQLSFSSEYDVQDLLHALLRPWVADIRPEEYTPSYAGSNTRMDFLLPAHRLVLEIKFVRDRSHSKGIGDELIIDSDHYRRHPECDNLWCVVFDPQNLLVNPDGLKNDLEGIRSTKDGSLNVKLLVL